jgi:hypothetical protein
MTTAATTDRHPADRAALQVGAWKTPEVLLTACALVRLGLAESFLTRHGVAAQPAQGELFGVDKPSDPVLV